MDPEDVSQPLDELPMPARLDDASFVASPDPLARRVGASGAPASRVASAASAVSAAELLSDAPHAGQYRPESGASA